MRNTGNRSGSKSSTRVGCSQARTWRSGTARRSRSGTRVRAHAPAQTTRRSASWLPRLGHDADAVTDRLPGQHRLAEAQLGAGRQRTVDVRQDRALSEEEAALGLEDDPRRRVESGIRGIPTSHLGRVEHLVRQVVKLGRLERATERASVLRPALERAGGDEQPLAGIGLEVVPQLVRPPEQRHVRGVLVVREADDPGDAVRRAELVEEVELLQPEHALAASREVIRRGRPHPSEADDDCVVPIRHRRILRDEFRARRPSYGHRQGTRIEGRPNDTGDPWLRRHADRSG